MNLLFKLRRVRNYRPICCAMRINGSSTMLPSAVLSYAHHHSRLFYSTEAASTTNNIQSTETRPTLKIDNNNNPMNENMAAISSMKHSSTAATTTPMTNTTAADINDTPSSSPSNLHEQIKNLDDSLDFLPDNTYEQAESITDAILYYISPARYLTELLDHLQDMSGLPWWATIASCTFLARVAMIKFNIGMTKYGATKSSLATEERSLYAKIRSTKNPEERIKYASELREFKKKHQIEEWRLLQGFAQFPIFVTFLYTLRQMAQNHPSLIEGGMLWFKDLSQTDPYLILPIISALLQLTSFEISQLRRFQPPGTVIGTPQKLIRYFIRTITIGSIFFTRYFPTALFMYWIPSNIFQIMFVLLTKTEWFKKRYNIPDPSKALVGAQNMMLNKMFEEKSKNAAKRFLPTFLFKKLYPGSIKSGKVYTQAELKHLSSQSDIHSNK